MRPHSSHSSVVRIAPVIVAKADGPRHSPEGLLLDPLAIVVVPREISLVNSRGNNEDNDKEEDEEDRRRRERRRRSSMDSEALGLLLRSESGEERGREVGKEREY